MKSYKSLLLSLSFILIISCTHDNDDNDIATVSFTEISKSALYGNGDEGISQSNLVITNNTDWQNLMDQMNTVNNVTDDFTETDIDFDAYEIIAIFLDVKPSGWEVKITEIIKDDANIHVYKTDEGFIYSVMTQPFHIVKIPKSHKPVIFH